MKKVLIFSLVILAIIQLCVPTYMIINRYDTLKNGTEFKFKVAPVDPYDAFRGRYVSINVNTGERRSASSSEYKTNAVIKNDENGFAYVYLDTPKKPENETDYIKSKIRYGRLYLPFDRYYMDENLAPKAETTYRNQRQEAYIKVKVKNGNSVIEGLYIGDKKIEDYVKNN